MEQHDTRAAKQDQTIRFTIPGAPVPKARARVTKRGNFTPKRTRQHEALVKFTANFCMRVHEIRTGPLMLYATFNMPIPKSWSKKKRNQAINGEIKHTAKPDLTNLLKTIEDGMNNIVYRDDSQLISISAVKRYDEIPGTIVTIMPAEVGND